VKFGVENLQQNLSEKIGFDPYWSNVTSALRELTNYMEQSPYSEVIVNHLVKIFSAFHGTRKIITVFTTAHHWRLPEPDASSPHLPALFT